MHSTDMEQSHFKYMHLALEQARAAAIQGEVPIGAALVDDDGEVLALGHNQTIRMNDPTAHAEIVVLRKGAQYKNNYRLLSTTLYATVEPCVMCMGALIHSRVKRIVFGALDPKWGAAGSLYDFSMDKRFNHRIEILGGVCELECQELILSFFRNKRN